MSNHSSIFSFDTLEAFPRPNRVFWLTVAILVVVRLLLALGQDTLAQIPPRSQLPDTLAYLGKHQGEPKVLFLGSSRIISCVKPELFAELAGWSSDKVLNLAVQSGDSWDAYTIARKNENLMSSVDFVVFEVRPWMFNNYRIHTRLRERVEVKTDVYRWGTWTERAEIDEWPVKIGLLNAYIWPLYERRPIQDWAIGLYVALVRHPEPKLAYPPRYHYDVDVYQRQLEDPYFTGESMANSSMHQYHFAQYEINRLERLVQFFIDREIPVVLLQPPFQESYINAIAINDEYATAYAQMKTIVQGLESNQVSILMWDTPSEIGLDDTAFVDYGHYNAEGAAAFTRILFAKLQEMGLFGPYASSS